MAGIRIVSSTGALAESVRAFNARLASGGVRYQLPVANGDRGEARTDGAPELEHYVAIDRHGDVRGGYSLQYQDFMVGGVPGRAAFYKLPLSEGLIDPRFAAVGVSLVRHTLATEPHLFVLGIGGRDEALARLLTAWGWPLQEVPFYFRLLRPARVLPVLARRHTGRLGTCLRLAHLSGGGVLAGAATAAWARVRRPRTVRAEPTANFGSWADDIWEAARTGASFIARRDGAALQGWYGSDSRLLRYRVHAGDATVGWAVALDTRMRDHRHFGDLRVATVVDALALPAHEPAVAQAVTAELAGRGADLVLSNQSGRRWRRALRHAGFMRGPSRFLFGAAPRLRDAIGRLPADMHLTRGDGDGPLHL